MKVKLIKVISVLLFYSSTFAQNKEISNKQTPEHIFVGGTKIAMIPPENFIKATAFSGFQQPKTNASIMITELPAPYSVLVKNFTAETLKSRGMDLLSKEDVMFQGQPAVIYKVKQAAQGVMFVKYLLVFGDEKGVVMLNGIFPESETSLEESIKKALYSSIYQKDKVVNPFEDAPFQIDLINSNLKFANAISGTLLFTSDGFVPVKSTDKAFFSVGQAITNLMISDRKQFAIDRLKMLPNGTKITVENIAEVSIDKMSGYEINAWGEDEKGQKELVYQNILFVDNTYYIMVALASNDYEKYLGQFRSISQTFKRK